MKLEELREYINNSNLKINDEQLLQFDKYAKFLKEYNQKINLTAIDEYEEVIEKHFYDSILPSFKWEISGSLLDVGAGAGFPSIPLKILLQDLKVTIVEPLNKRCVFLNELINLLELKDVKIVNARAEDYVKDYRESFDYVSARAVANLNVLSELCIPFVKVGGYFIAMKGQQGKSEIEAARQAIALLGCKIEDIQEANLIDGSNRVNIKFLKAKSTPKQYPRNYGQIKKKPL